MDVKEIRLECLKLALDAARRSADLGTATLVERAGEYERYVQGRAASTNAARGVKSAGGTAEKRLS